MNKEGVFLALVILVVLIAAAAIYIIFLEKGVRYENADKLCWNSEDCMEVEIFNTPYTRKKGLTNRPSLASGKGALMEYKINEKQYIIMQNMAFPIDVVWLNKSAHVIKIHDDLPQCRRKPCQQYESPRPVTHAVLVNANYTRRHRIKPGQPVRLPTKI